MERLPDYLHVKNKELFKDINEARLRKELNADIEVFLLTRETENDYYDLDKFGLKNFARSEYLERMQLLLKEIILELESLGWKCKYSYNDTGLFVYSTEKPPPSCW